MIELIAIAAGLFWLYAWLVGHWFAATLLTIAFLLGMACVPTYAGLYLILIGFAWAPLMIHREIARRRNDEMRPVARIRSAPPTMYQLFFQRAKD